jgi:hypothetical protein
MSVRHKCTSVYIIITLLHSSLFVSDWRRQVDGLLVKTYRHGISEIFLKVELTTKKPKPTKPFVHLSFSALCLSQARS